MFTVTIKLKNNVLRKNYDKPVKADAVLAEVGVFLPTACGGNGKCGKCKINLNGQEVLACKTLISSDSTIDYTTNLGIIQGLTNGFMGEFKNLPLINSGYAAAIDIGTTTVAGYVYKFPEGEMVKSICLENTQSKFGADVISRINYALSGEGAALQNEITGVIKEITKDFSIQKFVICGNTTMLYLLCGINPESLAVAPYTAKHLFGKSGENYFLMPCVSSFLGSDVTAAMLSCNFEDKNSALLVDIGTNGEMVVKNGDRILGCSTAAGPCFEGADIKCGTLAVSGAINKVYVENSTLKFETIDGAPPVGICGTGLIDAIAALLELGIIDESGYMEKDYFFGDSNVFLSPEDVRKFQLAKSAIRSGINTLLSLANVSPANLNSFYISGGFGSFLNVDSAVKTGLIPKELGEKTFVLGNGAGMGASMLLLDGGLLEKSKELAKKVQTVELSANSLFMEEYLNNMCF